MADELKDLPEFVTVDQLAACLGVGRDCVYREIAAGNLPGARRIGRCLRVHRDTVLSWFQGDGAAQEKEAHERAS